MDRRDQTWSEVNATRRSVTTWTGEVVPRELVREIVAEAHLAPSAFNSQPWRFVVARGAAMDRFLGPLGSNADKVRAAGTIVALFADLGEIAASQRLSSFYDGTTARTVEEFGARNVGLVGMALLHAAWSHGVGTRPMIGFDADALARAAEVPDDWRAVMVVALGWPAGDEPASRSRRPVDEVLRFVEPHGRA